MTTYETTDTHEADSHSLANDARALLKATANMADSTIVEARKRLEGALEKGKVSYENLQDQVSEGARVADRCVRENPYATMAAALAVGAIFGFVLSRRS